ncbi:MAG: pyridoxal phosphate-dependent aminotransferase [Candidatus Omnitrophica bacterium]|nr:pyridoxal phosphate-dependent aminotransferase [Candidatus Omnitrophota bacterium]
MKPLAKRIQKIAPSATLSISAKAKDMKRDGIDIIDFSIGEPDFDTPSFIKEAAICAIEEGFTKYTPASGIKELKEAVVEKFKKDNNIEYTVDQIVISCGAKHALYNCFVALCNPKDEVIIFSPYWVSYLEMVKLLDAVPIIIKTREDENFLPNPKAIKSNITKKTKAIIINTPSNPTGSVFSRRLLEEIADIVIEHDLWIISDEVYEKIIFDSTPHVSIASLDKNIKSKTLVINAVSKTYSMTGWRIGYVAGPLEIIKAIDNIQSHTTSNPASISQKAALAALCGSDTEIIKMQKTFQARRDFLISELRDFQNISFFKPQGAFYLFLNISKFFGKKTKNKVLKNSIDMAEYLLEEGKVAVVPGIAFGNDNYIRISFATSQDKLKKGIENIKFALNKIL